MTGTPSTRSSCSRPYPTWPWTLLVLGHPQPPWAIWISQHPHSKEFFPVILKNVPSFNLHPLYLVLSLQTLPSLLQPIRFLLYFSPYPVYEEGVIKVLGGHVAAHQVQSTVDDSSHNTKTTSVKAPESSIFRHWKTLIIRNNLDNKKFLIIRNGKKSILYDQLD